MQRLIMVMIGLSVCMHACTNCRSNLYDGGMHDCAWSYGKEIYMRYAEDVAGYLWTYHHSRKQSYPFMYIDSKNSSDLRIMTFNIQRVEDTPCTSIWSQRPWFLEHRLWRVIDVFEQALPDVACLQEIHPGMIEAYAYELPERYAYVHDRETPLCNTLPNPIVYNANRLRLCDVRVVTISQKQHRRVVIAEFEDQHTQQRLSVLHIHQDDASKGLHKALQSTGFRILREEIERMTHPYVILGDFNVGYDIIMSELLYITPAYSGHRNSWIPWSADNEVSGQCIDGIFVDPGQLGNRIRQSNIIVDRDEVDADGIMHHDYRASDHRPMYADIDIGNDA